MDSFSHTSAALAKFTDDLAKRSDACMLLTLNFLRPSQFHPVLCVMANQSAALCHNSHALPFKSFAHLHTQVLECMPCHQWCTTASTAAFPHDSSQRQLLVCHNMASVNSGIQQGAVLLALCCQQTAINMPLITLLLQCKCCTFQSLEGTILLQN